MSSLVQSTWEFLKNHKKKLIALIITCALGYGGFLFMKRTLLAKLAEVGEIGKALERKRKKEAELHRLKGECTSTISSFLKPLRKQLNRLTDVVPITNNLKELRARQKAKRPGQTSEEGQSDEEKIDQLWEDLKVMSMGRMVASVYALTLMDLLLRVQLHVAAKKALEARENNADQNLVTSKVREQFMFKATDFFVSTGLVTLLDRVSGGIRVTSESWMMGSDSKVSKEQIASMFTQIRNKIESPDVGGQLSSSAHAWFLSCLIQPDEALARAKNDVDLTPSQASELKAMLDETMDLLESPHFAAILEEALTSLFDTVMEDLFSKQLGDPPSEGYILAKVIVGVKLFAKNVLATNEGDSEEADEATTVDANRYVHRLEQLPALEELSRAILNIGSDDTAGLEGLGDMKELLPLLANMLGQGAEGGINPEEMQALLAGGNPPPAISNQ